jgi:hypothetical protein
MKWKVRLARDMAQEAIVVIRAPSSEESEAILWHDMDPDVVRWSNENVMGACRHRVEPDTAELGERYVTRSGFSGRAQILPAP